jgi:hypothetical protein
VTGWRGAPEAIVDLVAYDPPRYIVGQVAGITMGWVMLHSTTFRRWTAYTLIAGNVLGFGYYLPTVGLAVSAFSGVVLWVWFGLVARDFLRLSRTA